MQTHDRLLSDGAAHDEWAAAETVNAREPGAGGVDATWVKPGLPARAVEPSWPF